MDTIKGRLIVFEGLDGAGKSTQIFLLKKFLESKKVKVFLSPWNSCQMVKSGTKRGKKQKLFTPTTFSLIHCTDFSNRYEREIYPLLQAGFVVLCDRYIYTAFARDIVRGCDRNWIKNLYSFAIEPTISFFFHIPLETAILRCLGGRTKIKYFEAGMDMGFSHDIKENFRIFQGKIFDEYNKIVKRYNFDIIDASLPIKIQQDKIRNIVGKKIDITLFKWKTKYETKAFNSVQQ